ncbi:MAG: BamA/TamA family outer membrane protein [Bacteroidales bacterium]|nr:BamA/TamA family outer membrane protein [Bacteroidales bacterium]
MKKFGTLILWTLVVLFGLSGCMTTSSVPEGEYLYTKNKFSFEGERVKSHDIPSYFKQKVNRKIFIARPWVWFYDVGQNFKDSSGMQRFLCNVIGEKPILYDSMLVDATAKNILQHMHNLGYYNTSIVSKITLREGLKMANVNYHIYPNTPYYLRKVSYNIENRDIKTFVLANWKKSKLDTNIIFTTASIKAERERIAKDLTNLGYYYFSKKQITFTADSNFNEHRIDLTMNIKPIGVSKGDSIVEVKNKQYKIRDIYIYPEMNNSGPGIGMDTTIIRYSVDNVDELNYHFIHKGKMKVNPKSIINAIFLKPTRLYREDNVAYSYKSLFNLSIYKYIKINFLDPQIDRGDFGELDCVIELSKSTKFSLSTESELKNTGGDFGVEQGVSLITRNTFKGGEVLNFSVRGALEVQNVTNAPESEVNKILSIFNTFEVGTTVSLDIPRFLAPVRSNFFSRYFNPKTRISLGYNYQDRPDYSRYIISANFGYTWITNKYVSQIINPIEVSSVKINPTDSFKSIIDNYQDPRIKYSYQDHLVLGMSYSFIYNERKWESKIPFNFLFAKVEVGGIPHGLISNMFGQTKDTLGQYWVMGLPYTQFARFEVDYRYYFPMARGSMMNVFRINMGLGVPLFKSVAIPFEKSFYIGGANSLRAWTLGTLGPGSFNNQSKTFEMTGDIKIEMNYEFRFPISTSLRGAVFTDVGNIFLLKHNDQMPEGVFHFHNFYEKFAMDIGYGIRYDLSFLVIRFDVAHPVYQPYYNKGQRWSMTTTDSKLIYTFNFAIGYPF